MQGGTLDYEQFWMLVRPTETMHQFFDRTGIRPTSLPMGWKGDLDETKRLQSYLTGYGASLSCGYNGKEPPLIVLPDQEQSSYLCLAHHIFEPLLQPSAIGAEHVLVTWEQDAPCLTSQFCDSK